MNNGIRRGTLGGHGSLGLRTVVLFRGIMSALWGRQVLGCVLASLLAGELNAATNTLICGQVVTNRLVTLGASDYYCFGAVANEMVSIALAQTGGPGEPRLELFNPEGVLTNVDTSVPIFIERFPISQTGTWCVRVSEAQGNELFDYRLSLHTLECSPTTEACDGPSILTPGAFVNGCINNEVDMDFYHFTAASNDIVSVALRRNSGTGEARWQLYDPAGSLLLNLREDSSATAYVEALRLTNTGVYTVLVREDNINETYTYSLSYILLQCGANSRESCDGPETIQAGELVIGCVSPAVDMDVYCFTVSTNDLINIALRSGNLEAEQLFQLFDPDNQHVANVADNGNGSSYLEAWRPAKSGRYTLIVRESQLNETYNYSLSFIVIQGANMREACDGPERIEPGQVIAGCIGAAVDMDVYRFNATSNDCINLALRSGNAAAEQLLQLYDPDFVLVTNVTDNGYGVSFGEAIRLNRTGTYTMVVREAELNDTFNYTLSYLRLNGANERESADSPEIVQPGMLISGVVSPAVDMDVYRFEAVANDVVNIALRSSVSTVEPILELFAPDCRLAGTAVRDASGTLLLEARRLTQTGTYTLVVREAQLNETYNYSLMCMLLDRANARETCDGVETIEAGRAVEGCINSAVDMDLYRFAADANDIVNLELRLRSGTGEPRFLLFDPAFNQLSARGGVTVARQECVLLPEAGIYTLLIREDNMNETLGYRLALARIAGRPPLNSPPQYMQIFSCSTQLVVRWPMTASGFVLQQTRQLDGALPRLSGSWVDRPGPYFQSNGYYYVTNAEPGPANFFQLRKP